VDRSSLNAARQYSLCSRDQKTSSCGTFANTVLAKHRSETAREYEQRVPSLRTVEVYVAVKRITTRLPEVIWEQAASQGAVFK